MSLNNIYMRAYFQVAIAKNIRSITTAFCTRQRFGKQEYRYWYSCFFVIFHYGLNLLQGTVKQKYSSSKLIWRILNNVSLPRVHVFLIFAKKKMLRRSNKYRIVCSFNFLNAVLSAYRYFILSSQGSSRSAGENE